MKQYQMIMHRTFAIILPVLLLAGGIHAQFTMTLRKSFIDSFKNRVTITSPYEVYYAHDRANPPAKDGDLHIAGYDSAIGLPVVAELMNADSESLALALIQGAEGRGKPEVKILLEGAWRLWSEHIKRGAQYFQGEGAQEIKHTNPDHVFEIHPVTKIDTLDLSHTLREVEGYTPYDGKKAFRHYLDIDCSISQDARCITIETRGARYNYADFWIKLNTTEKYEVEDGLFVYCTVLDKGYSPGKSEAPYLLSSKVRMAFVKDSAPYFQAAALRAGDYMHVMGIPRISLAEISRRARRAAGQPSLLHLPLPLEMIIVGILVD